MRRPSRWREARLALDEGCEELDMVINIGRMIRGDHDAVREEIRQIADLAHSRGAIVKVILETCYLTDEQKRTACRPERGGRARTL